MISSASPSRKTMPANASKRIAVPLSSTTQRSAFTPVDSMKAATVVFYAISYCFEFAVIFIALYESVFFVFFKNITRGSLSGYLPKNI